MNENTRPTPNIGRSAALSSAAACTGCMRPRLSASGCQVEAEIGGRLARKAQQHAADDRGAGAAGAGDHAPGTAPGRPSARRSRLMSFGLVRLARAWRPRFSAHRITKPPRMKVLATTAGVNRCCLMALPNSRPSTHRGRKAISTFRAKRCASRSVGSARERAPDLLPVHPDHGQDRAGLDRDVEDLGLLAGEVQQRAARIRCPVQEIGRNSVRPSTTPITAALTSSNNIHARSRRESRGLARLARVTDPLRRSMPRRQGRRAARRSRSGAPRPRACGSDRSAAMQCTASPSTSAQAISSRSPQAARLVRLRLRCAARRSTLQPLPCHTEVAARGVLGAAPRRIRSAGASVQRHAPRHDALGERLARQSSSVREAVGLRQQAHARRGASRTSSTASSRRRVAATGRALPDRARPRPRDSVTVRGPSSAAQAAEQQHSNRMTQRLHS